MTRLKRVAALWAGGTPTVDHSAYWTDDPENGIAWVSIGDMTRSPLVLETSRRVTEEGRSAKRLPMGEPGTVLFAMYASVGETAVLGTHATWNQAILGISPRTGSADSRFVRYWLDHLRPTLAGSFRSTTQDNLNADQVGSLPFPAWSLAEQRRIADFLEDETDRIDALVVAKQRLAAVSTDRLRTWVSAVLDQGERAAARRVTSLRTSGPRGWADQLAPAGSPFIRSQNLSSDSIRLRVDAVAFVDPPESLEAQRSRTSLGDVLIGITGANTGWVGLVDELTRGGYVSQHVAILRPTTDVDPRWLAYCYFSHQGQSQLLGGQYGGTKQQLSLGELAAMELRVPELSVQRRVADAIDRSFAHTALLTKTLTCQIELLRERRQALITAAVTGELEI